MIKKMTLVVFAALFALQATAQIRAYDPTTGKEMKLETLVDQGLLTSQQDQATSNGNLKKGFSENPVDDSRYVKVYKSDTEKRSAAQKQLIKMMNQDPESTKELDERKITNLGTVVGFVKPSDMDESMAKAIDKAGAIKDVNTKFYIKEFKNPLTMQSVAMKVGSNMEQKLSVDFGGKAARRMHVSSYPTLIYIAPDGSKARYALSSGGVTALKIKIGEVKTILQYQQQ